MDCKRHSAGWMQGKPGRWTTAAAAAFALLLCALLPAASAQVSARPTRVISINLCTDQLLLALADPSQVVALSRLARSELSYFAERAAGFRTLVGGAEQVLALAPDLVLAGAFSGTETRAFLMQRGVKVETFAPVTSLAAARDEIRRMAAQLGHPARGDALLASIDAKLAATRGAGQGLTAIAYERRGFAAGRGTLLDELMAHMGISNIAARAGLTSVAAMPLESVVRARPDVLIMDWSGDRPPDQGTALLLHPALDRIVPPSRRVELPARLIACAGPALPNAIDRLGTRVTKRS